MNKTWVEERMIIRSLLIWLGMLIAGAIIFIGDSGSATSSTSSPPTLWRLHVPSSPESGEYNDLIIPCNRSRHHITNSTFGVLTDGPGNYTQETTCEWLIEGNE